MSLVLLALLVPRALQAAPGLTSRPSNTTCLAPARTTDGDTSPTWLNRDIGSVAAAGSVSQSGGTFTVRGSGADIWNSADEFHFVYRQLTGDGDLIARVTSLSLTDPWAKAGVMFRESLAANSRFAMALMTPDAIGATVHYRSTTGGKAQPSNSNDASRRLPHWVRISRRGNVFSGYFSTNGSSWTLFRTVTMTMPATIYAGLAVTSHADGTVATAAFSNVSLTATGTGGSTPTIGAEDVFPSAPAFTQPTKILQAPGDNNRWFVLEKTGRVKVIRLDNPSVVQTWLDFSGRVNTNSEGGLLGLAFHPEYPTRRHVFVAYTTGSPMRLVVSRLILDSVTTPVNVTEQVLLTVNQPYDNHNGGDLAIGPDGNLYIGVGDGGSSGDPGNNAQNRTRLLGKILRIDAYDTTGYPTTPYRIPPDNPFAGNPRCGAGSNAGNCPEIFAWGFRNPWRLSFDSSTGALWVGDVGQNSREEIDIVTLGGNYGWRCREGTSTYNGNGCPTTGLIPPVFEYGHSSGNASITGGYVYRGSAIPTLAGRYVYGDFVSGRIWALRNEGGVYQTDQLLDRDGNISTFGRGNDGELYFADYASGRIYRLTGSGGGVTDPVPDNLASTGCVNPSNPRQPASGVIPYSINVPFWSDSADKTRFLALPNGTALTRTADNDLQFPPGAVLMKNFSLAGQPVETRLLMRHPDGGWAGYTYEWNSAGTAATRVRGGKTKMVSGVNWIYPSEGQCLECHTAAAGFALGPEIAQLNGNHTYGTGITSNQLETLSHIGVISPATGHPSVEPRIPRAGDPDYLLDTMMRGYLHANCSNCHRPGGPTGVSMDLRYRTPLSLADTGTCHVTPQAGTLGIANARLIAPGAPERSVLLHRMARRDAYGMPPLGSSLIDANGVVMAVYWIQGQQGCTPSGGCHSSDAL